MSESVHAGPRPGGEAAAHPVAAAFRKHLPGILGTAVSLVLSVYVLLPLFQIPGGSEGDRKEKESYNLDCFLVRDASGSVDPKHYGILEEEILGHLSTKSGDRISYSRFGSDVVPDKVPSLSADEDGIAAQRRLAESRARTVSGTTDFARLFDRLREAIRKDRERQKAMKREPHADAILILSDGVPDLTPDQETCDLSDKEIISDEIVDSYEAMIKQAYATREALYVRLILVGAPSDCAHQIHGQWERRLGAKGLEVLSFSELGGAAGVKENLLRPLRRHPRIFLQLGRLQDEERSKMDLGKRFSVQFSAQALGAGGTVRVESGLLVGQRRTIELYAVPMEGLHPVFSVPSPPSRELWGSSIYPRDFYLLPESPPIESETYRLEVKASVLEQPGLGRTIPSVEVAPLDVPPCNRAGLKSQVRERLKLPYYLSAGMAAIFIVGTLAWYSSGKIPRVHARLEGFLVVPYRRWIFVFLLLLLPVAVGIAGLREPWPIACCVVLALTMTLFLLEKFKTTPEYHLLLRVAEFAALPLITEVAAQYLT